MPRRFNDRVKTINWLLHRWEFTIKRQMWLGAPAWQICIGGCIVSQHDELATAEQWIKDFRPISLMELVERHQECRVDHLLIESSAGRLARIPRTFWHTYDAVDLCCHGKFMAISAKSRAMFPDHVAVFVRGYPKQ